MSQEIAPTSFIKPYYIDALGEDGVTARDIATSLKTRSNDVRKKIEKHFLEQCKLSQYWRAAEFTASNDSSGLRIKEYALNIRAAKVFIATYRNKIGASYLDFLFDCERVATELTPKLIAKVKDLELRLQASEDAQIKRDRKLIKAVKQGMILAPTYHENLFGLLEQKWEMRQKETLNEVNLLSAKLRHAQKTVKGLVNKIDILQDDLDKASLHDKNKKRLTLLEMAKNTET